jgi:hypothetical protein
MPPDLELPVETGEGDEAMAAAAEENVMQAVLSGMAAEAAASQARRTARMDQLSADSASMWAAALTTPTVNMGLGFRVAQQSGGYPAKEGTGTG